MAVGVTDGVLEGVIDGVLLILILGVAEGDTVVLGVLVGDIVTLGVALTLILILGVTEGVTVIEGVIEGVTEGDTVIEGVTVGDGAITLIGTWKVLSHLPVLVKNIVSAKTSTVKFILLIIWDGDTPVATMVPKLSVLFIGPISAPKLVAYNVISLVAIFIY